MTAKRTVAAAGVPVIPGSLDPIWENDEAIALADEIGYPVMVKAAAGGGGKGMRVARDRDELIRVLEPARSEAQAAFGSDAVYIERMIERPRHIEIQVLGDQIGNLIHLGERECSLQRRHQKVLEEAPFAGGRPRVAREDGRGRHQGRQGRQLQQRGHRSSSSSTETATFIFSR